MPDIHKRIEKAEKYLQKGKQLDALNEYLDALEEDPHNDQVRQTAADIAVTINETETAKSLLGELFDHQAGINDQAKAIANYKKLARLGTPTIDQTFKFSQFIEKSDKKLALEGYKQAVEKFSAASRTAETIAVYKSLVNLDPSADHYKAYAEYADRSGEPKLAAAAFLKYAQLDGGAAPKALARGYKLDKANGELALAYSKQLIADGRASEAVTILKPITNETSPAEF